jgi:LemA protein
MKVGVIVLIVVLAIVGFAGCNGYNGLVKQDEAVKKAWNNVQTEYQNRSDLVGNLVNIGNSGGLSYLKGY